MKILKSYGDEATDFHDKQIPKVGSDHISLAVINFDSVLKKYENYYPQVFLKVSKYIENEKKVIRHITDDLESSCDDSDEEQIKTKYLCNVFLRVQF